MFVIDVSEGSVRRGIIKYVCEGIRRGLYGSKRKVEGEADWEGVEGEEEEEVIAEGERVAIITVGETVGFWNLSVSLKAWMEQCMQLELIVVAWVYKSELDGRV